MTRSLAHEVAHHLVAKRGYIFTREEKLKYKEYEEAAANCYAAGVVKEMLKRWYYRFGQRLIKELAESHYINGVRDWSNEKSKRAAEHWYIAQSLNPDHDHAVYWYWRAKRICNTEEEIHIIDHFGRPVSKFTQEEKQP